MSISHEQAYSYAEILEVLSFTHIDLVKKIPQKLISIFKENAISTYQYHLDKSIPLENQEISPETASLITLLSMNYWCNTEEEKNELKQILIENEKIQNENLRKKYNTDNLFNNTKHSSNSQNDSSIEELSDISEIKDKAESSNISISTTDDSILPLDTQNLPFYKKILLKIKNFLFKNK